MTRQAGPRNFRIAWAAGWAALVVAAFLYARQFSLQPAVAIPCATAFLTEYIFYLVPGFPSVRETFAGSRLAPFLAASVLIPYLIYAIPTGQYAFLPMLALLGIALLMAFWYRVLPPAPWADLGFIAALAALLLSPTFKWIYSAPAKHVAVVYLGHLFLVHAGALIMLVERRLPGIGFGFIPNAHEAVTGLRNFLYFIPVGGLLGAALHVFLYKGRFPVWFAPLVFVGYYATVALSEEFAFRGVAQQSLAIMIKRPLVARAAASVAFGAVHLWFPGPGGFPNWRMMVVASAAGWFYGRAFDQANGIRAAMLTHALTVTVWMVWLL